MRGLISYFSIWEADRRDQPRGLGRILLQVLDRDAEQAAIRLKCGFARQLELGPRGGSLGFVGCHCFR